MKRVLRPVLERAVLLGLGTLLALGLAEGALRLFLHARPALDLRGLHELRPDRPWLYGLRPGAEWRIAGSDVAYRINADGFRGPRYARPKPDGRFRVLVLGDSVAFGFGVAEEDTFPRVLEAELATLGAQAHPEVVNLGVGGYNAWNEVELLRDVALGYEPDLVLVQFCINDLDDPTLHFDAHTRLTLATIPDAAFPAPSRRKDAPHAPSLLLSWCARSKLCSLASEHWLAPRELDSSAQRVAIVPVGPADTIEWRWLEARYLEMALLAASAGARFAVLAFPYRRQLAGRGPHPMQERVLALAHRHRWTAIDPLPALRAARAAGTEPFLDPWHPTPAGHRIAAEETLRTLACARVLGDGARGACTVAISR